MRRPFLAVGCALLLAGCGSANADGPDAGHAGHGAATAPTSASAPAQAPAPEAGSATAGAAPAVGGDWNLADVMFLQMAIANHDQGIQLASLADKHNIRPELRNLADAIRVTQQQELGQMKKWLTDWGKPIEASTDPNAHAAHGGMPITDPQTISDLDKLPDAEFEKQFIPILTGHQHNAVEFALDEGKEGVSGPVKAFADKVVKSRTAQIQQLLRFEQQ
ncbi:DUF305 domain-containing protein [Actinokineospora enzanensis]|uniref:DUF305 domain-containing protein n=1 Tax=Actinokineospora enzanensis TaxID=155975 RepID=UPI00037F9C42|nr:DUF305 domain-containing protein [Actinokineospora enzanensis]